MDRGPAVGRTQGVGTLVRYHGDKQRYEVAVRAETGTTALKVENLEYCGES